MLSQYGCTNIVNKCRKYVVVEYATSTEDRIYYIPTTRLIVVKL